MNGPLSKRFGVRVGRGGVKQIGVPRTPPPPPPDTHTHPTASQRVCMRGRGGVVGGWVGGGGGVGLNGRLSCVMLYQICLCIVVMFHV